MYLLSITIIIVILLLHINYIDIYYGFTQSNFFLDLYIIVERFNFNLIGLYYVYKKKKSLFLCMLCIDIQMKYYTFQLIKRCVVQHS